MALQPDQPERVAFTLSADDLLDLLSVRNPAGTVDAATTEDPAASGGAVSSDPASPNRGRPVNPERDRVKKHGRGSS